jgi:hypothetical protein
VVVRSMLSTEAGWRWQTAACGEAPPVTGLEGEGVRRLRHTVELLWEEEGDEDLTRDGEVVRQYCPWRMGKSVILVSLLVRPRWGEAGQHHRVCPHPISVVVRVEGRRSGR